MKFNDKVKQVLSTLGLTSVTKDKSAEIDAKYKELFNSDFLADMEAEEAEAKAAKVEAEAAKANLQSELAKQQAENAALKEALAKEQAEKEKLMQQPEVVTPEIITMVKNELKPGRNVAFFMDRKRFDGFRHNIAARESLAGYKTLGDTIDVADLVSEFGAYLNQPNRPIFLNLYGETPTVKYFQTIPNVLNYRMSEQIVSSVVQGFIAKWTPSGEAGFKPIEIVNRRHKFNVPIIPNDIYNTWLGVLYDEGVTDPSQHPISQWLLENYIKPQVDEDREYKLFGRGVYVAVGSLSENDPGQATGLSMDGLLTILEKHFAQTKLASPTSDMNFIELTKADTAANLIENINYFIRQIPSQWRTKPGIVFCSMDRVSDYITAQYDNFLTNGVMPSEFVVKIANSNKYLVGLPSLGESKTMFYTPSNGIPGTNGAPMSNMIRLIDKNNGATPVRVINKEYEVRYLAEWHEAIGFGLEKLVWASIDKAELAADETAPDAADSTCFVCNANSQPTAITDVANAVDGAVYTFVGNGSGTNDTTIAKSGKFSTITGAWTAKKGNILIVKWNSTTSKFVELYVVNA